MNRQTVVSRAKTVKHVFSEKKVTFLAGSIAYSAFVSLVPLVMFLLLAVSIFGDPALQEEVITVATESVSPSVGGVIEVMIEQQRGAGTGSAVGASLIGVLTLIWGSIKVFRGLDTAFSAVYETTTKESFVGQIRKSLLVLATVTVGALAMVGATSVVAFFSFVPLIELVVPLLLLVGLGAAFFPMYYLFPDVDVEPRDVLPGTVVAAVGWTVLQILFQVYVSVSGGDEGNLIASILLLVTWLYFSGVVLLLGAVVNAVAGGVGDERAEPDAEFAELDAEMTGDELAVYLRRLREDLAGRFEGMRPMDEGGVDKRVPSCGVVSVNEWVEEDEDGTTHEVRLRWNGDADRRR